MQRRELLKYSTLFLSTLSLSRTLFANEMPILDQHENALYLNFNENNLGPSESVKTAILRASTTIHRYPDNDVEKLKNSLATQFDLSSQQICLGNGSSELIFASIFACYFYAKNKQLPIQLITPTPTFHYAEKYAKSIDIDIKSIPLLNDFSFNIAEMEKTATQFDGISVVYLCNPNNPTGTVTPFQKIASWLKKADPSRVIFIFDEAYMNYVQDENFVSGLSLIKQNYDNIIVTRTFSKCYALAGLRIGYAFASEKWTSYLSSLLPGDNINKMAATAAITAINDDVYLNMALKKNNQARKIVYDALNELHLNYLPSQTNFVFHQINTPVSVYSKHMAAQNIFVGRYFAPYSNWNRLTLGTPEEMQYFVNVLKQFRQKNWV